MSGVNNSFTIDLSLPSVDYSNKKKVNGNKEKVKQTLKLISKTHLNHMILSWRGGAPSIPHRFSDLILVCIVISRKRLERS